MQKRRRQASPRGPRAISEHSAARIGHTRPPTPPPAASHQPASSVCPVSVSGCRQLSEARAHWVQKQRSPAAQTSSLTFLFLNPAGAGPQAPEGVVSRSGLHRPQATRTRSLAPCSSKALASWPLPHQAHFSHSFPATHPSPPTFRSLHWHSILPLLVRRRPRPLGCGLPEQAGSGALPSYESYVWNSEGSPAFLSGCHCFLCSWKTPPRVEASPRLTRGAASAPPRGQTAQAYVQTHLPSGLEPPDPRRGQGHPSGSWVPAGHASPCGQCRHHHAKHWPDAGSE